MGDVAQRPMQEWVQGIADRPVPILAKTRQRLKLILGKERLAGGEFVTIVQHDPLLTAQLIRTVNTHGKDLANLEQCFLLLGRGGVQNLLDACPDLEATPVLSILLRRAWHRAWLTRDWAFQRKDHRYQELFLSGSLYDFGTVLFALFYPEETLLLEQQAQKENLAFFDMAMAKRLGFSTQELNLAIAQAWHFPPLLVQALSGINLCERSHLIHWAHEVMLAAPNNIQGLELQGLQENLQLNEENLHRLIFRSNVEAARGGSSYLQSEHFLAIYPSALPRPSFVQKVSTKAPPAIPDTPLQQMALAMEQANAVTDLFTIASNFLQEHTALARIIFFTLNKERTALKGKHFVNIPNNDLLRKASFDSKHVATFFALLDPPQTYWLRSAVKKGEQPQLSPAAIKALKCKDFYAAAVTRQKKALGLAFACPGENTPLTAEHFKAFREVIVLLNQNISRLAKSKK